MLLNFLDDFNPVGWGWLPAETEQEIPAGGVSSFLQLHFPPRIAIIVIIIFATTIIITSWASQGTLWYKEILRASFKRHPVYIHLAFINLLLRAWNKKCVIFLILYKWLLRLEISLLIWLWLLKSDCMMNPNIFTLHTCLTVWLVAFI